MKASSAGLVALGVVFTVALRIPYLGRALVPDEAGLLIIAQNWAEGPYLYGDYFVGRGIVLVLFYLLADALGGAPAVRLLAVPVAVTLVVAAGWAGHQLRGSAGAGWATLVAAAYSSTYAFSSEGMNGRLLGAAFVMVSCALTITAVRRGGSLRWGVAAGVLASLPVLVVQSYVDAWVFAAVFLVGSVTVRALDVATAVRVALGGLLGLLVTAGALLVGIATTWLTLDQLWFQLVGYRVAASLAVVESTDAPAERLSALLFIAATTGVLLLVVGHLAARRSARRRPDLSPVWWAVVGMLALDLAGMVAGGDWWPDYLLQPVPALALTAAVLGPAVGPVPWSTYLVRVAAFLAPVAAVVWQYAGIANPVLGTPENEAAVGEWIAGAAEPGDDALVVWGKANVLHAAGMTTPYPYLWSLVMRTLDPELEHAVEVLSGEDAPTWLVIWHDTDAWGLDTGGALAAVVEERYEPVGTPCGTEVLLRQGERRDVLPEDACSY
jgi:type IV secretory pathway TrbD component